MTLRFRPVTRKEARTAVHRWHSHHRPHVGEVFAIGAEVNGELVAVVVAGRPVAQALDDGRTWEVTRLCIGPDAPRFTASRLLGRIRRVAQAAGVERMVSYTRADEKGTCYKASGWSPVATVPKRDWARPPQASQARTGWLPGLYRPSTETVDRVRWECCL